MAPVKKPLRKGLSYALSAVVGFGLLGGILYYTGWRGVLEQMRDLDWDGMMAVAATVVLGVTAAGVSWWIILRSYGIRLSFLIVGGSWLSSYAVTYLTPSMYFGGEPIRAILIADRSRAPATRVVATIVVERVIGGLSLIIFVLIGTACALASSEVPPAQKRVVLAGAAFVALWIGMGLLNFAGNFKWISRATRWLGRPIPRGREWFDRAALKVSETEDEIHHAFANHRRAILLVFVFQMLASFFAFMRPQVFFHFSAGRTFDFSQLSLLFTLNIFLGMFLWITPGGVGMSEAALIGIYKLVNVGKEGAVAFSLSYKCVEFAVVAIGVSYMLNRGIGRIVRSLKERSQSEHPAEGAPPSAPAQGS